MNLEDFHGRLVSGRDFAEGYHAAITPTLLFLNSAGDEVTDRIVGISNLEYYGFYLNRAIDTARSRITVPR